MQEGGTKVLIQFATQGTEAGRTYASNALAKIGITINPEIAFPGQRVANQLAIVAKLRKIDINMNQTFLVL